MVLEINKIIVKRLNSNDVAIFKKLVALFQEIFETETSKTANEFYLHSLLERTDFIAYVIMYDDEVVGGLTAYILPMYYHGYSEVFIYDIAVKSEFQRKGLGKRLLSSLEIFCRQNGIKNIFVAANEEDEHAIEFYNSTGGKAEKVVHFNYSLNDSSKT